MRSYQPPVDTIYRKGLHQWDLDWSFLPQYAVIKPVKKLPTMEKGFTLPERDWRYDNVSRKIMEFSSYPPIADNAYGVVNQSSLFAQDEGEAYQGIGLSEDRVRVKDLIGSDAIQVQGLPPMGILPVGTVMSFSNKDYNIGFELFTKAFGKASFAEKLVKWTWIIVDNTNANANGLVDGKNNWRGRYTYRIQRVKMNSVGDSDWDGLYTANKTNMVDISSDVLHDLLRLDAQEILSKININEEWEEALAEAIKNGLEEFQYMTLDDKMSLFMHRWYIFNAGMNDKYSTYSVGCVKIHIRSSLGNILSWNPKGDEVDDVKEWSDKIRSIDVVGMEDCFYHTSANELLFRSNFDFDPNKPVRSGFLIPFLPRTAGKAHFQQSCYPSLLWPLIHPNYVHTPFEEDMAWRKDSYHEEHEIARAWRQGFADLMGVDLWELDNPHQNYSSVLQYIDYPLILYILRWLNGKPSFGGPLWADYQQNTDYIYSWMGANRKPDTEYERKIELW